MKHEKLITKHLKDFIVKQMNLSMKQKQTHRHREQTCGCQRGGGVGEG